MTGRSVLVTGGSRGIGGACVEALLADGHRVAAMSRTGSAPAGALGLVADVSRDEDVRAAVEAAAAENGPVEVLIANAGQVADGVLVRMSPEQFGSVIDVNLIGSYRLSRAVLPGMMRRKFGRLIYVSSVVALSGSAGQANYAASKAGLIGFARALAREYGSRGITSNVVSPGLIATEMTAGLPEGLRAKEIERIPAAREGMPGEVAAVIAFLAGEQAGYVNGAVVPVDGGLGMGH